MVFCNCIIWLQRLTLKIVTILILIDGFLQYGVYEPITLQDTVTILILIDGFLQSYNLIRRELANVKSQSLF